ncbi:folylpolyglutamate synthase isoform X1 [Sesamum indicum]|uniref:Folylpolyglutamate synthase n=1 Tax=Sesamum indicum TaxID=4182 RepID=A0A6I9SXD7_SESIN|nr:folylpolyglutamate synthase isoform X1 [Sesamum indicum]XP_020548916.1 folylpolyglutamate synthase isoform X1 [Sesamum indicum]
MLKNKNLFLRLELGGVSGFYPREHLFPSKLTCAGFCLSACLDAVDLTGDRRLHSPVQIGKKGFGDRKLPFQVLEPMESNTTIQENAYNLGLPSAYDTAMETLSSLITSKRRGDGSIRSAKYDKLERMLMYIKILGLEEHIAGLKIIHVAGTKGKGSTCTFCEAILRECGFRTGLFTSPHLIDVRERFRLDGMDISEEKFLHYFWECWHQLKENLTNDLPMPPLFQFLTVLAFKIFACEKVDVAIIEVGLGGIRDSTNVIKNPVVCGVSPLGMDHMEILGDTLEQIASHKAGILKPQVPAFTVPQLSEAMDVLQKKAMELKVPFEVVAPLDHRKLKGKKLSLSGDHQFTNAGLAVALCKSWLQTTGNWAKLFQHDDVEDNLPEAFVQGLSTARLSGRAQIVYDSASASSDTAGRPGSSSGDLIFYLDGAHSPESLEACARWFSHTVKEGANQSSVSSSSSKLQTEEVWSNGHVQAGKNEADKISKQILLFNCMDVRDPKILLPTLVDTCASSGTYFSKAIFVPSISTYGKVTSGSSDIPLEDPSKDLTWQFNLQRVWEKIIHGKDCLRKSSEMQIAESTPPRRFIDEDMSNCKPSDGHFACSAVVSSLPMTINWLRDYVKENPSFRIQVLVTGSLHLVGDVLKLLRR